MRVVKNRVLKRAKRAQRAVWKTVSRFGLAAVVAFSGLAIAMPSVLGTAANAAPNTAYTSENFSSLGLQTDRTAPSGGDTIGTTTLSESVVGAKMQSGFYQWEGLQGHIASNTSIEASLYVDPSWTNESVTAGLWGITQSSNPANGDAYPIIAYTNKGGTGHFEMFDTMITGNWTTLPGTVTAGNTYTLEIAYNSSTKTYDFYVNNVKEGSETAVDSLGTGATFDHFTGVIFDNYNAGGSDNYTVQWSNFATGFAQPTGLQMLDNTKNNYASLSTGVVRNTTNPAALDLTWNAVPAATHYVTTTYYNGMPLTNMAGWTGTPNNWVYNAGFSKEGDGIYSFQVCAYNDAGAASCTMSGNYIYDHTAPQNVTITPSANAFVSGTTTWTVTDTDANPSYIYVELNHNGNWITDNTKNGTEGATQSTLTYNTTTLANGTYTIKVDAVDQAGNTTQETYNYTVYNTTPTLTASATSGKSTSHTALAGTATLSMTLNNDTYPSVYNVRLLEADGTTPVQVNSKNIGGYVSGDSSNSYTYDLDTTQVPDGTYVIQFSARDQAGNTPKTVFETVTIDNTAPTIQIDNTAPVAVYGLNDKINTHVSDTGSGVADTTITGVTDPSFKKDYGNGSWFGLWWLPAGTYSMTTTDVAGNATTVTFTRSAAAPTVTYTSTTYGNTTPTITGTVNDPNATIAVTINGITGAATNNGDGTWSYTVPASDGLVNGQTYPVSVTATNAIGNTSTAAQGSAMISPLAPVPTTNIPTTPSLTVVHAAVQPPVSTTSTTTGGTTTSSQNANAGVLGDSTTTSNASNAGVKGDSITKDAASAVSGKHDYAWYWWLILLLVVAGIVWWIIAAARRRKANQ